MLPTTNDINATILVGGVGGSIRKFSVSATDELQTTRYRP